MLSTYRFPAESTWEDIVRRPVFDSAALEDQLIPVMHQVRDQGDAALRQLTLRFDGVTIGQLKVTESEMQIAMNRITPELFEAIKVAAANITTFHQKQITPAEKIETMPGVVCWRKTVAIDTVGLYIPGGTAPLFSTVLMLAIPALIAGCRQIVLCTPPSKDGTVHPAILTAARYLGISQVYKVGGVQAIAAMTFGTPSIPRVQKIFGPGNQYVTTAKQLAQKYGVAIDMPAGPSEVAVYADSGARADFVAADLLSQAEHGADSQVLLVTDHEPLLNTVKQEVLLQLETLPRKDFAERALTSSKMVLVKNAGEAMALLNRYAPEHLILHSKEPESLAANVVNAGSVFLGYYSPESVGDYASGTNHTLPTNGYAQAYSGVSVDSFVKKITFQQLSADGLDRIAPTVVAMAEAEGLTAHARAVLIRQSTTATNPDI